MGRSNPSVEKRARERKVQERRERKAQRKAERRAAKQAEAEAETGDTAENPGSDGLDGNENGAAPDASVT